MASSRAVRWATIPLALLLGVPTAPASDYEARLAAQQADLLAGLTAKCPESKAEIEAVARASKAERAQKLAALARCGDHLELFHAALGAAHMANEDFPAAEKSYRSALKLRVTEAAQVGLLTALVRQKALSAAQKADLAEHLAYFEERTCSRDDLCAALSYVAWHMDQHALTKRSAERAIALGFPGWQPYFFGGAVYALGGAEDRVKAVELLREAKRRSGPPVIDRLLADLGARD